MPPALLMRVTTVAIRVLNKYFVVVLVMCVAVAIDCLLECNPRRMNGLNGG